MADDSGRAANDPPQGVSREKYDGWFEASPDPWAALAALDFGADRTVAFAAESATWISDDTRRGNLEKKLLGALEKSGGRPAAILAICKLLALVGGDASVPALAGLLKDPATASYARIALEPIPGAAADAALRDALSVLPADELAGLIGTIAARRDAGARPMLEKIAATADAPALVRTTAENALALIGR